MTEHEYKFKINAKVHQEILDFIKAHKHPRMDSPVDGKSFKYSFTHTSIGTVVEIQCCMCRKKKDVTDYDCW
jgi:hypothetical protein